MTERKQELRKQILDLVGEYCAEAFPPPSLRPRRIGRAGLRQGLRRRRNAPAGRFVARFLAHHRPLRRAVRTANSRAGSASASASWSIPAPRPIWSPSPPSPRRNSATAACSPATKSSRVAAGFPTTVNPIIQNGLVPVFIDVTRAYLQRRRNASWKQALSAAHARPHSSRTRWAIPSTSTRSKLSPRSHDLWLIEDCCDAVGADVPAAARSAPSATWPPPVSIPRITSPWAKAAAC